MSLHMGFIANCQVFSLVKCLSKYLDDQLQTLSSLSKKLSERLALLAAWLKTVPGS